MPADDVRGQGAALPLVFFILLVFAAALLLRAWGPALSEAMLRLSAALLRPLALFAPGYAEAAARISALEVGALVRLDSRPAARFSAFPAWFRNLTRGTFPPHTRHARPSA